MLILDILNSGKDAQEALEWLNNSDLKEPCDWNEIAEKAKNLQNKSIV